MDELCARHAQATKEELQVSKSAFDYWKGVRELAPAEPLFPNSALPDKPCVPENPEEDGEETKRHLMEYPYQHLLNQDTMHQR